MISKKEPCFSRIQPNERKSFESLATRYFKELNANFIPSLDWKRNYFLNARKAPGLSLRWIQIGDRKAGFALVGVRSHPVLSCRHGVIFEFYIRPPFRRNGFGCRCARLLLEEFREQGLEQVQLEIAPGNCGAAAFWTKLGARKCAERYRLTLTD